LQYIAAKILLFYKDVIIVKLEQYHNKKKEDTAANTKRIDRD